MAKVTEPEVRMSARRARLFRALLAMVTILAVLGLLRIYGEARRISLEVDAMPEVRVPRPGDTLRVSCVRDSETCRRLYDTADLEMCLIPDCESPLQGFTTNTQGFVAPRERIYEPRKGDGVFRILALGGSTTGGSAWAHNWPAHLERLLEERGRQTGDARRFEVMNLGVAGIGSRGSWRLYEVIARNYDIDLVIVGEEVNDFGGCAPFEWAPGESQEGRSQRQTTEAFFEGELGIEELAALSPWFSRHAQAFEDERRHRRLTGAIGAVRSGLGLTWPELRDLNDEAWLEVCSQDEPEARPSIFDDYQAGWTYTSAHYDTLLDALARDGIEHVMLTTVPSAFEHWRCPHPTCAPVRDLNDWRRYITEVHNPGVRHQAHRRDALLVDLERRLDRFVASRGADAIDPEQVYEEYQLLEKISDEELARRVSAGEVGKLELFAVEWMHPSGDGHRLIAEIYLEALSPMLFEATNTASGS